MPAGLRAWCSSSQATAGSSRWLVGASRSRDSGASSRGWAGARRTRAPPLRFRQGEASRSGPNPGPASAWPGPGLRAVAVGPCKALVEVAVPRHERVAGFARGHPRLQRPHLALHGPQGGAKAARPAARPVTSGSSGMSWPRYPTVDPAPARTPPAPGASKPGQDPPQDRLAAAARSYQADALAGTQLEVEPGKERRAGNALAAVVDGACRPPGGERKEGGRGCSPSRRRSRLSANRAGSRVSVRSAGDPTPKEESPHGSHSNGVGDRCQGRRPRGTPASPVPDPLRPGAAAGGPRGRWWTGRSPRPTAPSPGRRATGSCAGGWR